MTISKSSASGKTIAVLIRDDTQRRSIPIVELAPMMCDKDQVIKLLRDPEDFNLTIFAI
ncbi:MAG: hypothetical protein LBD68_01460 [Zoogloeaceae bacterium]|nr:hypothetical protein [Zoogloeaceae bacterium]